MQIVEDRGFEFRPAARAIDVLDAQQEAAVSCPRNMMAE